MSTADTRTTTVDLRSDVDAPLPDGLPSEATLEIDYGEGSERTVTIEHGADEWTFEFAGGECIDRDPTTRPVPKWINQALETVESEIR